MFAFLSILNGFGLQRILILKSESQNNNNVKSSYGNTQVNPVKIIKKNWLNIFSCLSRIACGGDHTMEASVLQVCSI